MKYSEYFEIDKNYYPEINPDSVKNPGNEWQYTYPHETFVELLSSVELMLSRENTCLLYTSCSSCQIQSIHDGAIYQKRVCFPKRDCDSLWYLPL